MSANPEMPLVSVGSFGSRHGGQYTRPAHPPRPVTPTMRVILSVDRSTTLADDVKAWARTLEDWQKRKNTGKSKGAGGVRSANSAKKKRRDVFAR